jgi:hypothetical protein
VLAGIALMVSIFLLVLANLVYIMYNMIKGKDKLKVSIKAAKIKRKEEEEQERKEEEERKAKKKKEEEEFTKIPDATQNDMSISQDPNTTYANNNNTTMTDLTKPGKRGLKKKVEDNLEHHDDGMKMPTKKTPGYEGGYNKGAAKSSDPVTKGKFSDDKMSKSSHSMDSENDGKVIR